MMEFVITAHQANVNNIILPHERIRAVAKELKLNKEKTAFKLVRKSANTIEIANCDSKRNNTLATPL